jgi:hypothetical protein
VITDSSLRSDARGVLTRECRNLRIVDAQTESASGHSDTVSTAGRK